MSHPEHFGGREAASDPVDAADPVEDPDSVLEACEACGEETPHIVSIEILTESQKRENAAFSREPYRVTECRVCGETTQQRMNNA
ncbi:MULTISPECIES: hypothetical protein [Halorussus]|uniref:DUF7835 family putative zinc beta-ribbon protein n=1 Tax=Halorussus TaxID=1070314 RepID=UPI00209F3023|nr:hypothetical protein [Halorussus vallis]USZ77746.1 hypothetical protein NGM07_08150 [Halorussus vallis]